MKRFRYLLWVFTAFVLIGSSTNGLAQNTVEGSLTVDGTTTPIKYLYFDQYRGEFTIVLTDNPVPQEMIPFEVSSLSEQGKVRALEFTVSREAKKLLSRMRKGLYFHPVWTRHLDIGNGVLTISKFDNTELVGTMTTPSEYESEGHRVSYDISFSVSLKKEPLTLTITGKSDPPSQAYAAYSRAVMNGDVEEFKKYFPSENLATLPKDEKELALGLEFIQDMMMTEMEILTSTISGDTAVLTIKGNRGLSKSQGTVKMVQENGLWKVSEESWNAGDQASK